MKNDQVKQEFSDRLIEALEESGIRDDKYASTMAMWVGKKGKNPYFARKWMTGQSIPGKANLKILAKELSVREEWLEYGTGQKQALDEERQNYVDQAVELLKRMTPEEMQRALRHIEASID